MLGLTLTPLCPKNLYFVLFKNLSLALHVFLVQGIPTEVEPTPIPEESDHLDDYDEDAQEIVKMPLSMMRILTGPLKMLMKPT